MYSQLTYLPNDKNWTLVELNSEQIKILIPSLIYTCALTVVGLLGNSVVLYVYFYHFKASTHRCFIIMLGLCDIVTCAIGMPFLVADMIIPYMFTNSLACRLLRFVNYFTSCVSICTLLVIAIERHRKICKPMSRQMTVSLAKRLLLFITVPIGALMSVPSIPMYGYNTIYTGVADIYGVQCFTDDDVKNTPFPLIYNMALLGVISTFGSVITYCYIQIARNIHKRAETRKNAYAASCALILGKPPSGESSQESENFVYDLNRDIEIEESSGFKRGPVSQARASNDNRRKPGQKHFIKRSATLSVKQSDRRGISTLRLTKMLFLITSIYSLSFLPHLSIMITIFVDDRFLKSMNFWQASIYQVVLRSFLLNSVANPLIYNCMDTTFKKECKKLFRIETSTCCNTNQLNIEVHTH